MKTNNKIYILEFIIFILLIGCKLVIDNFSSYLNLYLTISFISISFLSYNILGIQRSNKRLEKVVIQTTLIVLLIFVLLSFLVGILVGFVKNPIPLSVISIIKVTYGITIMIVCEEFIRYMIAKKCISNKKLPLVIITILFIIIDVLLSLRELKDFNIYNFFILFTTSILPSVVRNVVASFICYNVSLIPGLIFRLFFALYTYIFPVFPDYGNYVASIIGITLPYILCIITIKQINNYERTRMSVSLKRRFWYINIPLIGITVILLFLISGFFKYQIMAVGSGSMNPTINYGDAVIYEHFDKSNYLKLKKGDIIVFKRGNDNIVHRIVEVEKNNKNIIIKTKGDNNDTIDDYIVSEKDLLGIVRTNIKYIGYPTVKLSKIFRK